MIRWQKRNQRLTYATIDCITLLISYQIAINFYEETTQRIFQLNILEQIGQMVLLLVCFVGMFLAARLYDDSVLEDEFFSVRVQAKTLGTFILATGLCVSVMNLIGVPLLRLFILFFVLCYYGFYILSKVLLLQTSDFRQADNIAGRRILLVGCTDNGRQYIEEIDKAKTLGLKIIGYIDSDEAACYEGLPRLGDITEMEDVARALHIDEIVSAIPLNSHPRLEALLDICQDMGITVSMLLACHNPDGAKVQAAMVGNVPVLKFHTVSLNENQILIKRTMDVCIAIGGMLLFGVVLLLAGPFIIMETPGPVIEKQRRIGRNGRVFEMWQFRTHGIRTPAKKKGEASAEQAGIAPFSQEKKTCLTGTGAFLQQAGLARLPSIYNVLHGDLSLVGTMPSTPEEVDRYEHRHRKRLSITPGITGPWRLHDPSRLPDLDEMIRLDSEYITNWTVGTDFSILFRTALSRRPLNPENMQWPNL